MFAYVNQNADNRILNALAQEGFTVVRLAPFSALENPVYAHADMLLLRVGDALFYHGDYNCEIKGAQNVIAISEPIGAKYPNDVLLNVAIVGNKVLCNEKYTSKTVLNYLNSNGFEVHHVPQGYAHCSTCIVTENAIITSDASISSVAESIGIDVLKIDSGHVSLPPYEYGFIGGATGVCNDKIYFCGSLKYHPNCEEIRKFCKKHSKEIVELMDAPLTDVGGILFI